jgi:hypothetical protein
VNAWGAPPAASGRRPCWAWWPDGKLLPCAHLCALLNSEAAVNRTPCWCSSRGRLWRWPGNSVPACVIIASSTKHSPIHAQGLLRNSTPTPHPSPARAMVNSELSLRLFRVELERSASIDANLLALEQSPVARHYRPLMRAGHSIKGRAHCAASIRWCIWPTPRRRFSSAPPGDLDRCSPRRPLSRACADSEADSASGLAENTDAITELTGRLRAVARRGGGGGGIPTLRRPRRALRRTGGAAPPRRRRAARDGGQRHAATGAGGQVMLDAEQMDAFTGGMAASRPALANCWDCEPVGGALRKALPENLGELRRMMTTIASRSAARQTTMAAPHAQARPCFCQAVHDSCRYACARLQTRAGLSPHVRDLAKSLGKTGVP